MNVAIEQQTQNVQIREPTSTSLIQLTRQHIISIGKRMSGHNLRVKQNNVRLHIRYLENELYKLQEQIKIISQNLDNKEKYIENLKQTHNTEINSLELQNTILRSDLTLKLQDLTVYHDKVSTLELLNKGLLMENKMLKTDKAQHNLAHIKHEKHEKIPITIQCVVCWNTIRDICFYPCRHFICCTNCAINLRQQKCPFCRASIERWEKIYL